MEVSKFFTDEDAVSPVIGVILMVAITVILAAVIGTFVLGLGGNVSSAPQAQFTFNYEEEAGEVSGAGDAEDAILLVHDGGDEIPGSEIEVTVDGNTAYSGGGTGGTYGTDFVNGSSASPSIDVNNWVGSISAGDSVRIVEADESTSTIDDGDSVRIIWKDPNSDNTNTIAKSEVGF